MPNNKISDTQVAIDAGLVMGEIRKVGDNGIPFIALPENSAAVSLEKYLPAPIQRKQRLEFKEPESFIQYVKDYNESPIIFSDGRDILCVLDYHLKGKDGGAKWGCHTAALRLRETPEWEQWRAILDKPIEQSQFAEFLEDRVEDIIKPKGADVLEMALKLQATKKVSYNKQLRLENGDIQLNYEETTEAKAGAKGNIVVPTEIKIGVKVYDGTDPYEINLKMRYRLSGGECKFILRLPNYQSFIDGACKQVCEDIEKKTKVKVFYGSKS